jgi:alpha-galactosidase
MQRFAIMLILTLLSATLAQTVRSQRKALASQPPMGWNSWDCFGTTVRESEVEANADYMASRVRNYG